MNPVTLALTMQVLDMLLAATAQAPAVIAAVDQIKALLTSGIDPTAEQESAIRTALDAANTALQAG
jgi:C4-dicarboxylate-specific signal transduction histidine kinase